MQVETRPEAIILRSWKGEPGAIIIGACKKGRPCGRPFSISTKEAALPLFGILVILRSMLAEHFENLLKRGCLVGFFHRTQFARETA